MSYTKIEEKILNLNEKYRSDGSELIPAEVQVNVCYDEAQSIANPSTSGSTVDDEGLINNYAIEPDMYPSDYPSPWQQRRYIFLGVGAVLFVVTLILVAFTVS